MDSKKFEEKLAEVVRKTESRCKEVLNFGSTLAYGDAIRILYEELGLVLTPLVLASCGYSWELRPVVWNDDGHIVWTEI